jgi:hypothetical protein
MNIEQLLLLLDWSSAPPNAQWWAVDRDGRAWWYERQPGLRPGFPGWVDNGGGFWRGEGTQFDDPEHYWILAEHWQESLQQRPGKNHE